MWFKVSDHGSILHATHAKRSDLSCFSIIREWTPARKGRDIRPCPECVIISSSALCSWGEFYYSKGP